MSVSLASSLPLVLMSVICGVFGQLALKAGMTQVGQIGGAALTQPAMLARVAASPLVVGGLALYVLGAASWLTVLSRVPLSLAYPILALGYVITPLLAWLILKENMNAVRGLGILVIALGVILVTRS